MFTQKRFEKDVDGDQTTKTITKTSNKMLMLKDFFAIEEPKLPKPPLPSSH
jgi:hypothetical protein